MHGGVPVAELASVTIQGPTATVVATKRVPAFDGDRGSLNMPFNKSLAVATVALLAVPTLAIAETSPLYITLGAGLTYLEDADLSGGGSTTTASGSNPSWALMGAVGMGVFDSVRAELELAHRDHGLDNRGGELNASSIMANMFYDIPVKLIGFTPYVGAGLGAARINADEITTTQFGLVDDKDWTWAYQGIAGVAADVANNLKVTLDYRYFSTFNDPEFSSASGTKVDGEFTDHTIMLGFRYSFGPAAAPAKPMATPAAAPMPAPAPAPAPAASPLVRSFLVFFDFDRSDITADARKIITQAAENARKAGGTTRITLTGHADRSGAAQYNMRLSQRRADAVKAELVKMGVPAGDIATVAKGESDPLVPTADGVREPRNRRVEIVF